MIGFTDALVIGLNSTSLACSLAAVFGLVVALVAVALLAVLRIGYASGSPR